ncbi:MAG: glycosyltransferase [Muribaculaceae bacterium]|nr:glycosyltransferase [Muribaculaceae bacterium]
MMSFSFNISPLVWTLLAVGFLLGLTYVVWRWLRTQQLSKFVTEDEVSREYLDELPPVSIIVDACNETDQLVRFLPLVLNQEYPEYEVIVITDSAAEATSDMLSEMKSQHPNLHTTFTPHGTRSLSRKKLALMIGIKAAKHDIVLTTNANCRPTSDQWLRLMARNFVPGIDVVLGYSHYRYHRDKRWARRWRILDTVTTATQWLGSAIAGRPYRGTTDNLAYRKQLFFDVNGFARTMNLTWGEDDVFLCQIARGDNTRVELAAESQLSVYYENIFRAHRLLRTRRDFTSRLVPRRAFIEHAAMSWLLWLAHAAFITAAILAWPNAAVLIAAVVALIGLWVTVTVATRHDCRLLQAPPLRLTVPALTLARPLINANYRFRELRHKKTNYTTYI